jgi:NADH:ubiquinone oxidoreductase subunit E
MPQLIDQAVQVAGVEMGKTTADGAVTLEVCRCVGACSQAPVIMVDEDVVGRVRPNKLPGLINKLREANPEAA